VQAIVATLSLLVAALALAGAAVADSRRLIIPDRYALAVVVAFAAAALGRPLAETGLGVLTGLAVFAIGAVLFARGWLGGGDVKLIAAAALWAGPSGLALLLQVTAFAGAALALVMLVRLRRRTPGGWAMQAPLAAPMPFGVAIAAGGLAVLAGHLPPL
jgi:prepilin peptidase CpaA